MIYDEKFKILLIQCRSDANQYIISANYSYNNSGYINIDKMQIIYTESIPNCLSSIQSDGHLIISACTR